MLVIGGLNSSNTNKLYDICKRNCGHVFRYADSGEFEAEKIKKFKNVGLVLGASTPDTQTQEVLFKMDSIDTEVKATTMNEMDEVVAQMDNGQSKLKRGQLVTAIISSASDEGVAVLLPFFKKEILTNIVI